MSNLFAKRLREAKDWDVALVYCKGLKPSEVERGTKFIIDGDYMVIPCDFHMNTNDGTPVKMVESVIHMEEIVRIDFFQKLAKPIIQAPEPSPLVSATGAPITSDELKDL